MLDSSHFPKLLEPLVIGQMSIKNRVMMPAMVTCFASEDHYVTARMITHYEKRAAGGVGLIIVEATCVDDPVGLTIHPQLCIDDDKYIPGFRKLAEAVHRLA